jgi:hypothetical protein
MKALVIYESMFGNTRAIAEAVRDGLATHATVDLANVNQLDMEDAGHADLMVVGGPTHVHGMTRARTREEAVTWTTDPSKHLTLEPDAPGRGIRDWSDDPMTVVAPMFAAFATRADVPILLSGNAAAQIDRALRHRGSRRVAESENFLVTKENRLQDDELDRARAWGESLAVQASRLLTTVDRGADEG